MLKLILIHPGSTDYDKDDRIQGCLDVPLNAHGDDEVRELIGQLGDQQIEVIYSPASEPAEQTARTVAEALGVKVRKLERLQNLDQGLWQGMRIADVRQKQPKVYRQWQEQPEHVCPPEGEMLYEAEQRVRQAMSKLLKRHKEGVVGLVLPEPLWSLAYRFITRSELGDLWAANRRHGCWESVDVDPEEVLAPSR